MGRIVAIDIGQKRVGLAVTDPYRIIATGLDTLPIGEVFDYLGNYMKDEEVDMFVVGSPVTLNNQPSDSVIYVNPFVKKLLKMFPSVPVERVDERFTSSIAKRTLIEGGAKKKIRKDKAMVDKISAVIILQSYLENL
jgi:putative holliday junction resolvase